MVDAGQRARLLVVLTSPEHWERLRELVLRLCLGGQGDAHLVLPRRVSAANGDEDDEPAWFIEAVEWLAAREVSADCTVAVGQSFEGIVRTAVAGPQLDSLLLRWPPRSGGASEREGIRQLMGHPPCRTMLLLGAECELDWQRTASIQLGVPEDAVVPGLAARIAAGDTGDPPAGGPALTSTESEALRGERMSWRTLDAMQSEDDQRLVVAGIPRIGVIRRLAHPDVRPERMDGRLKPLLVVSDPQGVTSSVVHRLVSSLSAILPTLSEERKVLTYRELRRSARPDKDFYVMMSLAAGIATLGLILNSPAVVIGAMLVAPLMAPIVASGLGVIQGDMPLLKLSVRTIWGGTAATAVVSVTLGLLTPGAKLTPEVMARAHPSLLDLFVAVFAGAAASYAMSRERVSAALPGVAIAAALVPPLSSAGVALSQGDLETAERAALLYCANLLAIAGAATVTFLGLGFRPEPERTGRLRVAGRGAMGLGLLTVMVAVPLIWLSNDAIRSARLEQRISTQVSEAVAASVSGSSGVDFDLKRRSGGGRELTLRLRVDHPLTQEERSALRDALMERIGASTTVLLEVTPVLRLTATPGDSVKPAP